MSIANLVHSFRVWDAATGRAASTECALISSPFHTESVFDQDKGYLFLLAIGAQAVVWDLEKQRRVESGPWRGLRFSPRAMSLDLRRVAGGLDALTLYDTVTGDPLSPPLRKPTSPRAAYPVVFSPDGLRLVAGSGERAQLWDLPPDYRPIEDLVSLAELMAGRCIGGSGDFNSPERPAVAASWQRLRLQYPDSFAVSSAQARLWRENLVENCEQTGRAFGAIFHLTFLANENPNDENLRQRLARARSRAALENVR